MKNCLLIVLLATGIVFLGTVRPCLTGGCAVMGSGETCAEQMAQAATAEALQSCCEVAPAPEPLAQSGCCCAAQVPAPRPVSQAPQAPEAPVPAEPCGCVKSVECPLPPPDTPLPTLAITLVPAVEVVLLPEPALAPVRNVSEKSRAQIPVRPPGGGLGFVRTVRLLC